MDSFNLKDLYDLDLKYETNNHNTLIHSYGFQTKKITIAEDISFITESGQDFKVN